MDTAESAHVLIVDDRPEQLLSLEAVLSGHDPIIVKASSGKEALRHVLKQDFACILLDVHMPVMDGFETATLIRQRTQSAHTPIIFVTSYSDDDARVTRAYSLGAVDYIRNPVNPDMLRAKVGVFVELFKKTAEIQRQEQQRNRLLLNEQKRSATLRRLAEAALRINASTAIEQTADLLTREAREILGADTAATHLTLSGVWDKPRVNISTATNSIDTNRLNSMLTPLLAFLFHLNKPFRVTRPQLEEHPVCGGFVKEFSGQGLGRDIGSWLSVPLTGCDGRSRGLIHVSRSYNVEFTEEDEYVLIQLAQMASTTIATALYHQARDDNRMKDEFLAMLSHELRTPLTALLGWTRIMRTSPHAPEVLERGMEVIERNVRTQARLIEDLLDVSRIVSNKLRLNVSTVDMCSVIRAALDATRQQAETKKIEISTFLSSKPCQVNGDADRLQQVVWNLLINAIKFTPAGGRVDVQLECIDHYVRISVRDNGCGITPSVLPHIFERFRQADSSMTRAQGGLGLGLAIVYHLVQLHHGTILASSEGEGKGSLFVVTLPIDAKFVSSTPEFLQPKPQLKSGLVDLAQFRVLIVDDDRDTRDLLVQIVASSNGQPHAVSSCSEALSAVPEFKPGLVLSDIGMPDEDGFILIQKLRSLNDPVAASLPAIALTAFAREEDRVRAIAAGFQMHISKPVDPAELIAVIARVCEGAGTNLANRLA